MTLLGRRSGRLLVVPFAVIGLSLTGMAGGAATAHLTRDAASEPEAPTYDDPELRQPGVMASYKSAEHRTVTSTPELTTSVATTPTAEPIDDDAEPTTASQTDQPSRGTQAYNPPAPVRVPVYPPRQPLAPPARAAVPPPAPAPQPGVQMNLPSVNPQQQIRPGQLHFG